MGIRFYCSACEHKLNVKAFLAGRRGLCPYCGASIQIPTESTRPSSQQLQDRRRAQREGQQADADAGQLAGPQPQAPEARPSEEAGQAGAEQAAPPSAGKPSDAVTRESPATEAPAGPSAEPAGRRPPEAAGPTFVQAPGQPFEEAAARAPLAATGLPAASPSPIEPAAAGAPGDPAAGQKADLPQAAPQAAAAPPQPPPAAANGADPFAEAPDAVWYVRPPSGGQFGPATRDVMQTWLGEGRVSAESLVWREGWRDWRQAADVFPQLATGQMQSALASIATTESTGQRRTSPGGAIRHRQPARIGPVIIVVLILAVIILFGVLIWVLSRGPASVGEASTQLPARAVSAVHPPDWPQFATPGEWLACLSDALGN